MADEEPRFDNVEDRIVYFVKVAADKARRDERFLRDVEAGARRHPVRFATILWGAVADRRRFVRRRLIHVFGYDPGRFHSFMKRHADRWPEVRERWGEWRDLEHLHTRDSKTIKAMLNAIQQAVRASREPSMGLVSAWLHDQRQEVAELADKMAPWNDERDRAGAAVVVAGCVFAHLSPSRNRRLWDALGPGDGSERKRRLALRLPSAVFEAWVGGAARGDISRLPLEAARIIEDSPERKYRPRGGPPFDPTETSRLLLEVGLPPDVVSWMQRRTGGPPIETTADEGDGYGERHPSGHDLDALEEFAAHEHVLRAPLDDMAMAEFVRRTMRKYGLAERQAQVAYLRQEFPGWSLREIGAPLGIAEGTVKYQLYAVREKLRNRLPA